MPTPQSKAARLVLMLIAFAVIGGGIYVLVGKQADKNAPAQAAKPQLTKEQQAAKDAELGQWLLKKYGGISNNGTQNSLVGRVGQSIASKSDAKDSVVKISFHLLAEPNAINLFALPSGEVYVTTALVNRMRTEGELAAALSLGAAHVMAKHRLALPDAPAAQIPAYGATDGSAADARAVKIMADSGYSPEALLGLFKVLTDAYQSGADTQFFATHPSTDGRLEAIVEAIAKLYPHGVPKELSK